MLGRLVSFWDGPFSGVMLVLGRVTNIWKMLVGRWSFPFEMVNVLGDSRNSFSVCAGFIVYSAYPPRPLPQQENRNDCLPTIHFQGRKCPFQGGYYPESPQPKPCRYQRGLYRSGRCKVWALLRPLPRALLCWNVPWMMWAEHSWINPIHLWEDERLEPEKLGPPRKEDEHQNSQAIIFSGSIVNLPRCKLSGFEFFIKSKCQKKKGWCPHDPFS